MAEDLTLPVFTRELHTQFRVMPTEAEAIEVELVQAVDRGSTPHQEQFALQFRGPLEAFLSQRIYPVSHDVLGEFGLFLVPVAKEREGYLYEAVFNRLVQGN